MLDVHVNVYMKNPQSAGRYLVLEHCHFHVCVILGCHAEPLHRLINPQHGASNIWPS
jgi:hypothetical protein